MKFRFRGDPKAWDFLNHDYGIGRFCWFWQMKHQTLSYDHLGSFKSLWKPSARGYTSTNPYDSIDFLWNSLVLMHYQVAMLIFTWLTLPYSVFSFQGLSSCRAKTTSLGYPRRLHSLPPWKHWHFHLLSRAFRFHVFLFQHMFTKEYRSTCIAVILCANGCK